MIGLWPNLAAMVALLSVGVAAAADDFTDVEKRIRQLQPAAAEKRFDEIGWAKDIRHAKGLAREHNRPVFMFTHDGRMNLGRC